MQVLVLRLDYKSSSKIEALQKQIDIAGGKARSVLPPHISLQTFTRTHPSDLKRAAEACLSQQKAMPLSIDSVGFFKQSGTFFAAPAVTRQLLHIHSELHSATEMFTGQSDLYKPGNWTPHITIASRIAPPFWGPLFARLSLEFDPFSVEAAAVECWTVVGERATVEWTLFLS